MQKQSPIISLNEASSTSQPPVLSVRRALMTVAKELNDLYNIAGMILEITVLEENYKEDAWNNNDSHCFQAPKRSKTQSDPQRCQIVLRDLKHADSICLYTTQTIASSLLLNSIVIVTNCRLCVSQQRKKKMYITATNDTLRRFSIETTHSDNFGDCSLDKNLQEVQSCPTSSINFLHLTSSHNRCQWTLHGHVTFIKKVFVSLRCSKCCRFPLFSENRYLGYYCAQGCQDSVIYPLWETTLAFDDGTGEVDVQLEGKCAQLVLKAVDDVRGYGLESVVDRVNAHMKSVKRFEYDTIAVRNEQQQQVLSSITSAVTTEESSDINEDGSECDAGPTLSTTGSGVTKVLDDYLKNCSLLKNYELVACIDCAATASTPFVSASGSNKTNIKNEKKISLQEVNTSYPHRIQFKSMKIKAIHKLVLKGVSIKELSHENMRQSAWDLLQSLEEELNEKELR